MSDDDKPAKATTSHDIAVPPWLQEFIARDWDDAPPMPHPARPDLAPHTAARRARLSQHYPGIVVVIAAGAAKTRANDTDYPFRAFSAFTWLTGETCQDAVLVLTPIGDSHQATLYIPEYAPPGELGYYASRQGALWIGNVPTPSETKAILQINTRGRASLQADLALLRETPTRSVSGLDPALDELLPQAICGDLNRVLDELRLVKDDWEIGRLDAACQATARGFADVVRELPRLIEGKVARGERWLEGTFWRRARLEGNEVGYTSIIGAGRDATVLHWWRNHSEVADGQLLLADVGIETDELYTADITRTMPVNGSWSAEQLKVYQAVQQAQAAGIDEVKAGADFLAAHRAAMWVLADHLHSWGILEVSADVSCGDDPEAPGAGAHRRYTLHSTSHMLGIDVHDCAKARAENYTKATLQAGHVLTVEPGLYFQTNDRTVPQELRGIGVRIEDDIVVTDGAPRNLSASLPRDPAEITEWMREVQASEIEL